jgi:Protein of unknown function (DUF4230)
MLYLVASGGRSRRALWLSLLVGCLSALGLGVGAYLALTRAAPEPSSRTVVRPTGTVLMAVRDLARLETNELHMEKVIDLTDKQSRLFGLVDTSDAILLIAAGDVTIGIDLTKMSESDVQVDRDAGSVRLTLPAPEILSTRLDERHTYVYRRATGLLAERNEQLEAKARREAVRAIEEAARDTEVMEKARRQAEKQMQQLLEKFGISQTTIGFRPA